MGAHSKPGRWLYRVCCMCRGLLLIRIWRDNMHWMAEAGSNLGQKYGQVASRSDHGHRDELIGCLVSASDKLFATHDSNCFSSGLLSLALQPLSLPLWDWEEGQRLPFGNIWPNCVDNIHWTSLYGCQSSLVHNYNHVLTLWMKQVLKCIKAAS